MPFQCPVCKQEVGDKYVKLHVGTEAGLIELIRAAHPDWNDGDGICLKCLEEAKKRMKDLTRKETL